MESPAPLRKRRPGGRTAQTTKAVHTAVRELLEDGHPTPSVRQVAQRSGIHEVTIYRRWGSAESLLLDVAVTQLNEEAPFPDTGNLRADLLTWASAVSDQLRRPEGFAFFKATAAAVSPAFGSPSDETREQAREFFAQRADQIQHAREREIAAGGCPPTVEVMLDVILAPLYLRAIWDYAPSPDVEELVDRAYALAVDDGTTR